MATEKADGLAKAAVENIKFGKEKALLLEDAKRVGNEISGIRCRKYYEKVGRQCA